MFKTEGTVEIKSTVPLSKFSEKNTFALEPLMYESIQKGATMVTECRTSVGVNPKPMFRSIILKYS